MKILLSGGFGFIGKKLLQKLIKKKHDVHIIEHPKAIKPKNFKNIKTIFIDLTQKKTSKIKLLEKYDVFLHLAGQSSGPRSFFIPHTDIKLNVIGTLNVIELCKINKIKRIIFASSFAVYGDNYTKYGIKENAICNPKSVYATSKLACENLLFSYATENNISYNCLRMFNVYGEGQDINKTDQGIVGIFMKMMMVSNTINVAGSLKRYRDLIHIDDVVEGWYLCLIKGKKNKIYNLGSGKKTSIHKLLKSLSLVMKKNKILINQINSTKGDILGLYADISQIKKDTGFRVKYKLTNGLKKMYNFYK